MSDQTPQEGELILYRTADDAVRVEVLYESETFWLDQRRTAELFGVDVRTVAGGACEGAFAMIEMALVRSSCRARSGVRSSMRARASISSSEKV